jgi:hypothetical protein
MKTAEHTQTDKESFLSSWILLLTESASTCLWGDNIFHKDLPKTTVMHANLLSHLQDARVKSVFKPHCLWLLAPRTMSTFARLLF